MLKERLICQILSLIFLLLFVSNVNAADDLSLEDAIASTNRQMRNERLLDHGLLAMVKFVEKGKNSKKRSSKELKYVRSMDEDDCILRLVCELARPGNPQDSSLVKSVNDVFSSKPMKLYTTPKVDDFIFPFRYASHIGTKYDSIEKCAQYFPMCQLETDKLISMLHSNGETKKLLKKSKKNFKVIID